jgi:hypothetical protein
LWTTDRKEVMVMETYHKINAPFKRDMDGSVTGQKGKLMVGQWALPEFEYLADNSWEFTEKVDGTNIRINLRVTPDGDGGNILSSQYAGRTDNAVIPTPLLERLEAVFPTYPRWRRELSMPGYVERYSEVRSWMVGAGLENITLYGEGYGPKIQGGGKYVQADIEWNRKLDPVNPYRKPEHKFVLFDVKIGDFWLSRDNVNDIAEKLGIESVPVIGTGSLWNAIESVKSTPKNTGDRIVRSAYIKGGLKSEWGDFEAEGIVARPTVPLFNRRGERIITKIKGKDFK